MDSQCYNIVNKDTVSAFLLLLLLSRLIGLISPSTIIIFVIKEIIAYFVTDPVSHNFLRFGVSCFVIVNIPNKLYDIVFGETTRPGKGKSTKKMINIILWIIKLLPYIGTTSCNLIIAVIESVLQSRICRRFNFFKPTFYVVLFLFF